MSNNRKLSNEEVSALIEGLNSGEIASNSGLGQIEYKPFALGSEEMNTLGDLHTLRLINERFGRQLRNVLLPMLRFMPRISTLPPETVKFEEHLATCDFHKPDNGARRCAQGYDYGACPPAPYQHSCELLLRRQG